MVFLASEWMNERQINPDDDELRSKIHELLNGGLMYFPASWINEFALEIAPKFEAAVGEWPQGYSGFFYDSALAIATTFDFMLTVGKEYENPQKLRKQIFKTRTTGVTGRLSFDDFSNDRAPMNYQINNARYNDETDRLDLVVAGYYQPQSATLYSIITPIIWPDGTDNIPLDKV